MGKYIMTFVLWIFTSYLYANIASNILLSRTTEEKTAILSNIVNSAGEECQPMISFYQGVDRYDAAYWNLACANGRTFVIQIANDNAATTTIFPCSAMKSLGAACFERFGSGIVSSP